MSTRCNIQIYDQYNRDEPLTLYHHSDGYPTGVGVELHGTLKKVFEVLKAENHPYWWDIERVSAQLIWEANKIDTLSNEDFQKTLKDHLGLEKEYKYTPETTPQYQPCVSLHTDIEYLYKVYLSDTNGKFTIQIYEYNDYKEVKEKLLGFVDDDMNSQQVIKKCVDLENIEELN